jgi:hypothetical protein
VGGNEWVKLFSARGLRFTRATEYICPKCGHFNASTRTKSQSTPPPSDSPTPSQTIQPVTHRSNAASDRIEWLESHAHEDDVSGDVGNPIRQDTRPDEEGNSMQMLIDT